eukprot:6458631-Prymnesium_polylepis.3
MPGERVQTVVACYYSCTCFGGNFQLTSVGSASCKPSTSLRVQPEYDRYSNPPATPWGATGGCDGLGGGGIARTHDELRAGSEQYAHRTAGLVV